MAGTKFLYDKREIKFVLNEWLDMDKLFALTEYQDCAGIIDPIIDNTYNICRDEIAVINDDSDKIGVHFTDGKVITPDSFKKAYQVINDAGLGAVNADREAEGHLPLTLIQANYEMLSHASLAFTGFWGLTSGVISVIQQFGSEFLKQKFLTKMCDGKWGGTMNLTEPNAGTDVGANVTKAFPTDEPGVYKIKGQKLFITAADHDLCENFIHLVLARTENSRPGTAGLSLFIVPKYWVNDDGTLGESNDVITTGIEEKMGQHGSPTCALSYGENDNCRGYIIGNPPDESGKGEGIAQMFVMMNEERLNTGTQSLAAASAAYNLAKEYAKVRVQGTKFTDPKGPKVRIIEHEDVRRMLMLQKSCTEAIRALIFKSSYYLDLAHSSQDAEEREFADGMFQISNPLCKAYASDLSWPLIGEAIQVHGGYGYISEYQVEQLARDSKINSIWEGTDFIQSLDLVGRKFGLKKGKVFKDWIGDISNFIEANKDAAGFEQEFKILQAALEDYNATIEQLRQYMKDGKAQMMPLFSTRILHASSMLYCARLILDQGVLASKKLEASKADAKFYKGKIASARFYVKNVLPEVAVIRKVVEIGDASAIDIAEECFG
ncbi:Butyryl-CoA dehydrogenase [Sporomusa silvacetica DSM 10669]|uniref:Butyryl-CoA dehydrogenase n=1 Tax=Sporomusa silvacetica DSM 10669 TaxID=1123289 RepID=A0ABZ3IGC9_9FIRM|nr:acyl-CoA dehydrogenase [Sporomusa silvacetica]OZC23871.1 acyl-CoA dehydrogenase, short-chain specific [Sporomusa silvacetica DSM 10669]